MGRRDFIKGFAASPFRPLVAQAVGLYIFIFLGGCSAIQPQPKQAALQEASRKMEAAVLECRELRRRKTLKTFKESAECSRPKIIAAYQEAGYPYMDLIILFASARMAGAENLDKGKNTEAEVQLQMAELQKRIGAEEQKRNHALANAQSIQADSQTANIPASEVLLQGLGAIQPAQIANRPAACNRTGGVTNC
jgi:hypothetical protein